MVSNVKNREKPKLNRGLSQPDEREIPKSGHKMSKMKELNIKSACTNTTLDLSGCKMLLGKDKFF